MADRPIRVLFLCLGNICRSPLAEGVFRAKVEEAGLATHFEIDSAGTGPWHAGEPPDARMRSTAQKNGVDLGTIRGRQLSKADLDRFDHIFAMDKSNLHDALFLDPGGDHGTRIRLFREFDPDPGDYQVPDPYYGGPSGFDHVYAIVDRTAQAILERLYTAHRLDSEPDH
ncbi:MAG: low molecular weight phosphotyrosine protein phosphatase [Rhodothermaceae bacterium]|nr:low molecular weight phosphotyrosine protein phosphatase [Rhodothermaceae bacterium]